MPIWVLFRSHLPTVIQYIYSLCKYSMNEPIAFHSIVGPRFNHRSHSFRSHATCSTLRMNPFPPFTNGLIHTKILLRSVVIKQRKLFATSKGEWNEILLISYACVKRTGSNWIQYSPLIHSSRTDQNKLFACVYEMITQPLHLVAIILIQQEKNTVSSFRVLQHVASIGIDVGQCLFPLSVHY